MSDDRVLWEGIYRSLMSIAAMIKRHKLGGKAEPQT
jgi:hypothetical protein